MITVTIHTNTIQHQGEHDNYTYDELRLKESSGKRLYFMAIKNGIRMVTVPKVMQLKDNKVYISFGKVKYEIGTYEEETA